MRASSASGGGNAILPALMIRTLLPGIFACLALAVVLGCRMAAAAGAPGGGAARPSAPLPTMPSLPPKSSPMAASPIDNDAPARHARRTACLKDAKSKKLVGAQRTAYVKDCVGPS